jgi:hypothetical protein
MRPELETAQKFFMGLLCFYLTVSAILPLFGYNITLAAMAFETFNPEPESYYLYVIRSAAFMMLAFFGLNYLRRRRPLSSVAPLLVFNNFLILFGVLYQLISFSNIFTYWVAIAMLVPLSFWLYRQNNNESRTIFSNDW